MRAEEKLPSVLVAIGHATNITYISVVTFFRDRLTMYSRDTKNNIVHALTTDR